MIQKKRLLGLLLVPSLLLSACSFNLGTFEKDDGYANYYEAFAPLRALSDSGEDSGIEDVYNIRDSLFNDTTVNKLTWEKDEYKVSEKQYLYLIVTFQEELKIESMSFFFKSQEESDVHISSFYYLNDDLAPKKIKYRSSPSEEKGGEPIVYDDPPEADSNVSTRLELNENNWKSFTLSKFKQVGYEDGLLHTAKGGVFYIRIENNSGFHSFDMTPVSFTFLNFLVRAVDQCGTSVAYVLL